MIFTATEIQGLTVMQMEKKEDERGFLARSFDLAEFKKNEVDLTVVQGYVCQTKKTGTIRGLHYSLPSKKETKLVRVTRGSFYEVVVDLRPKSPAFMKWWGAKVKAADFKMVLVPPGCAHAVLALEDNSEHTALYQPAYDPTQESGIRFDDPTLAIKWPIPVKVVSKKDRAWADFDPSTLLGINNL